MSKKNTGLPDDRPEGEAPRLAEQIVALYTQAIHFQVCPCGCEAVTLFFADRSVLRLKDGGLGCRSFHDLTSIGMEMEKVDLPPEPITPTHKPPEWNQ
jgi:hypothetical protein